MTSKLHDEELSKVIGGGTDWRAFAAMVIDNVEPLKYPELYEASVSKDWAKVATLALPLIAKDSEIAILYKKVQV